MQLVYLPVDLDPHEFRLILWIPAHPEKEKRQTEGLRKFGTVIAPHLSFSRTLCLSVSLYMCLCMYPAIAIKRF